MGKERRDIVSTTASTVVGATTEQSECAEMVSKKSSSNDEELENDVGDEGRSESSDEEVVQSGDPSTKTPDVPRLVVPGLLGSVLEKFGQNKTSPLKSSEPMVQGLLGAVLEKIGKGETSQVKPVKKAISKGIEKSRNGKDMKKPKVAKKTATPKAFPSLARKSLAGPGKVAKKLQEKDPSQVVSKWECRKNPDVDYSQ